MYKVLKQIYTDEAGQGLVEYAIILFFAVILVVGLLSSIGFTLNTKYEQINAQMP